MDTKFPKMLSNKIAATNSRITAMRDERGMSIETMSKRLGMSDRTLRRYESDTKLRDVEFYIGASRILKCSMDYLLLGAAAGPVKAPAKKRVPAGVLLRKKRKPAARPEMTQ